jgi:hypothetical protein
MKTAMHPVLSEIGADARQSQRLVGAKKRADAAKMEDATR